MDRVIGGARILSAHQVPIGPDMGHQEPLGFQPCLSSGAGLFFSCSVLSWLGIPRHVRFRGWPSTSWGWAAGLWPVEAGFPLPPTPSSLLSLIDVRRSGSEHLPTVCQGRARFRKSPTEKAT